MKKIAIILFLLSLWSCNNVIKDNKKPVETKIIEKSPRFTIKELSSLLDKNASQIENYVIDKGYIYESSKDSDSCTIISFKNLEEESTIGNRYDFQFSYPKLGLKGTTHITWVFINEHSKNILDSLYLELKKEAELSGYKNWNVSSHKDFVNYSYNKEKTLLDFNIGKHDETKLPIYGIVIHHLLD